MICLTLFHFVLWVFIMYIYITTKEKSGMKKKEGEKNNLIENTTKIKQREEKSL